MTHTLDARQKSPGRLATEIVRLLMGKDRATYQPNVDAGDMVNVVNAAQMTFSGRKTEQKNYYRHSTYANGLKTISLQSVLAKNPGEALRRAVSRMLPKNTLRARRLKRLSIQN